MGGVLLGAPPWMPLLPSKLYICGEGGTYNIEQQLLAVCGAPSTVYTPGHIVVVLRRSPAMVEHQDRHHAVVLTELFPDTLLDRIPGIVIELNVC